MFSSFFRSLVIQGLFFGKLLTVPVGIILYTHRSWCNLLNTQSWHLYHLRVAHSAFQSVELKHPHSSFYLFFSKSVWSQVAAKKWVYSWRWGKADCCLIGGQAEELYASFTLEWIQLFIFSAGAVDKLLKGWKYSREGDLVEISSFGL